MKFNLPFGKKEDEGKKTEGDRVVEEVALATTDQKEARHRNRVMGYAAAVIGALFVLAYLWNAIDLFGNNAQPREGQQKEAKLPKNAVQNQIGNQEKNDRDWKTVWETKFSDLERDNKQLKEELAKRDRDEKAAKEKEEAEKANKSKSGYPKGTPPIPAAQKSCNSEVEGAACSQSANSGATSIPGQNYGGNYSQPSGQPARTQQAPVSNSSNGFRRFEFKFDAKQASAKGVAEELSIPMGFAVGITLTGADAPTFQWGQSDPQPLAVSVETDLITSGDKKEPMKGCMVLASAHGAVSSERAMPRLVKMECRNSKGELFSGSVEGWILGDDGKIGIKGVQVSRQGTVMARAFYAGLLDGIASIIRSQSTTVSTSALGTTSTINPGDAVQAGLSQGVINSTEKLQNFYIKIAEQIYPVIEVLPGRKVTVLFKGGQKLAKATKDSKVEETKIARADTKQESLKLK